MAIANVAISNTFNEFRTTTNEAITQLNSFTDGTGTIYVSNVTTDTINASSGATLSSTLDVTGNARFSSNVEIAGDLIVTGNTVSLNVESKVIEDPLIYLASNNYISDLVDIGFVGNYFDGVNQQHTGVIRHASDGKMYLFTGYEEEPTNNVIDVSNATFVKASIVAGNAEFDYITANGVTTDLTFTSTGQINVPVGATGDRGTNTIGAFRFNTDLQSFEGYNGSAWGAVGGGATGGSGDQVFYENDQIANNSYTITSGKNAMSTGPITVGSGVTITVPSGSRWVVL